MAEQHGALTLDVLDGLTVGVVLVAADCRILFANQIAELALCAQHGFKVCQSRLQPLDSGEAQAFELMVSEAAKTGAGQGTSSGGQREFVSVLARAAVAAGISGLFMETHPHPAQALSDGPNAFPLGQMEAMLTTLKMLDEAVKKQGLIEEQVDLRNI